VSSFGVAATQLFFRELKGQKFEGASMPLIFFVQNTFDRSYFPGVTQERIPCEQLVSPTPNERETTAGNRSFL